MKKIVQNFKLGQQGKVTRTGLATVVIWIMLVLTAISPVLNMVFAYNESAFSFAKEIMPNITKTDLIILSILGVATVFSLIAILKWHFWGVIVYFAIALVAFLINTSILGVSASLSGLISPLTLFLALHFGIENIKNPI